MEQFIVDNYVTISVSALSCVIALCFWAAVSIKKEPLKLTDNCSKLLDKINSNSKVIENSVGNQYVILDKLHCYLGEAFIHFYESKDPQNRTEIRFNFDRYETKLVRKALASKIEEYNQNKLNTFLN